MSITSREIKSGLLLATVAAALSLSACTPSDKKSPVAATINGVPISQQRVDSIVTQMGQLPSPEANKAVIDNLAYTVIAYQEALKKGLEKTPEVAAQLDSAKQSVLARAYVEDYIKNNAVTDAEIQAEYDKMKASGEGKQYKARHILVDKEEDAKDIIAKLGKDVKAFGALAKAQSKDTGSAVNGGDLGFFDPRSMVPEFGAAVATLEKGKFTTTPVKSQFGYHVIILDDVRETPAPTLEQLKPQLSQKLQQEGLKKYFDGLKAKAKIEITPTPTPAPASAPVEAAPAEVKK
jgi:peptidyl-prolyl cis-trans isomerase C